MPVVDFAVVTMLSIDTFAGCSQWQLRPPTKELI